MQEIYCGLTEFNEVTINKGDPVITVYGDKNNSTVTPSFILNLAKSLNSISVIEFKEILKIEDKALANLQVSKFELILPDTLLYIGEYAFQNCTAVNYIIIPSSVTYIGTGAFYNCSSLNHIYFREGTSITYIPEFFCSGGGLNSVGIAYDNGTFSPDRVTEFPNSITTINQKAFYQCGSMGNILKINDNITSIGDYAFYETVFDEIEIGGALTTGDDQETEDYEEGGYDTDRDIEIPYTLYLSSKRQFRYKHFDIKENSDSCTLYLMNVEEYTEDEAIGKTYTYKTSDDDFKFCLNSNHILVFKNGLLLPNTYYYLHSIINNPITDVGIVINVPLLAGDKIDIFYVTNDLKHMEVEYYDMENRQRYIKNGDIRIANNDSSEYRVMGEQLYSHQNWRTNYIKLVSPLFAISSKHSTFVFLNGKKVRFDELEDISDTIMSINTDYARSTDTNDVDMNAVRLEVMNHLDTQDIIEQMYINDGLSHDTDGNIIRNNFNNKYGENTNVYKTTNLIKSIDLTELEAYAKRTLLDDILNDLSDENLNKLFYDYNKATGPMTKFDNSKMNEPNFAKKEKVIESILDKYFVNTNEIEESTTQTTDTDGTVFYDNTDSENTPNSSDGNN